MAYGKPEIDEFSIKCEECGKRYKKITHAHVYKKHGLTIPEYKKKWGYCNSQPLEAFYVKGIRQECNKRDKAWENITKPEYASNRFKKGNKRTDNRRWQELHRLKKLNNRIKGKIFVLSPAELVCIFDLRHTLNYPKERIAKVMHLSINYVISLLKRKDVYNYWKNYYNKKG